jgi:hypothetical protein
VMANLDPDPTSSQNMTSWRNGNASDSRPEDWGFDSL